MAEGTMHINYITLGWRSKAWQFKVHKHFKSIEFSLTVMGEEGRDSKWECLLTMLWMVLLFDE